jgi:hypothetical protein
LGGSFHTLDVEAIGGDRIISISSVPEYNEEAVKRGARRIVWKDYQNLSDFADRVMDELKKLLSQ